VLTEGSSHRLAEATAGKGGLGATDLIPYDREVRWPPQQDLPWLPNMEIRLATGREIIMAAQREIPMSL
jgi:hypothetical protein